ncbi:MAG: serine/threonine-protein kinase [Kofleriaceae bacterium]
MGVVYRARHALLRRPTAIKLLPVERAGATAIARFEREVQHTAALTHPNTIAIFDFGRTPDGVFYYAMEYVDGFDLDHVVSHTGLLPPARVVHLLRQIAAALAEAHASGLVHRDIKPANLMLCQRPFEPDFVKVLDFGLAREVDRADHRAEPESRGIAGTPLFLAPESAAHGIADARSDIYALGAVAWFLLFGVPVFSGTTLVQVCAQHLHATPTPPTNAPPLPASLEQLLRDCLAKTPDARPADASAFSTRLDALVDIPTWTSADAKAWWQEWGTRLPRPAHHAPTNAGASIAIDLLGRTA